MGQPDIHLTQEFKQPMPGIDGSGTDLELLRAREVAGSVVDPEIPVITIEELGLLRAVHWVEHQIVVEITPSYTGCPATSAIQLAVETALLEVGFTTAKVKLVLSPPWSTDDITESGRQKLQAFGIAPPARRTRGALLFASEVVACPRCASTATTRISEFGSTACKALWRCDDCREPFDYFKCL